MTGHPPPVEPPVVRKGELEFCATPLELEVHVWDYHADPVHLSSEDLDVLGLIATEQRPLLGTSLVAPWRRALREGRARDLPLPQLSDEANARALHLGGLALLPVAEGVDVYVVSYHASPVRLGVDHLTRLGLRYRDA
ncbi:hypothetical protein [Hyalangium versicolor]|uniref:hypothetical protein n=1 Tax=Hyalangium versicolor TaxID=2861190 RepID=UPI001CCDA720|nr:hypothetical protein [Hyalangium versicolor]